MRTFIIFSAMVAFCGGCSCGISGDMVGNWICESQMNTTMQLKSNKTYIYKSFLLQFREDHNVIITYEGDWRGGEDELRMTPKTITAQNLSPDNLAEVRQGIGKQVQWHIKWEDKQRTKWTATDAAIGSFHRTK